MHPMKRHRFAKRFASTLGLTCLTVLCGLVLPKSALAWGPGVHMVTGDWILQNLALLPSVVAEPLFRYPGHFLQGCLSADIFIGKGSAAKINHSHNWSSGFALLENACALRRRAYAYGYLSHLAADTVAHNVYVPAAFNTAPGKGRFAHVYLEAQADRLLTWNSSAALGAFRQPGSRRAACFLRASMHQAALPFWLKTRMFQSSIAIGGSRVWRGSMRLMDAFFPAPGRAAQLDMLLDVSIAAALSLLQNPEASPVLTLDPIGADALAKAGMAQKSARSARDSGPAKMPPLALPVELASLPPVHM